MSSLPLLSLGSFLGILQPLAGCLLKVLKVAAIHGQLAAVQVDDVSTYRIEELTGMGHNEHCLGPFEEVVLQQEKHA